MFYTTKALDFPQPVLTQSTPQPQCESVVAVNIVYHSITYTVDHSVTTPYFSRVALLPSSSSTRPSSPPSSSIPPLHRHMTPARNIPGERHSSSTDAYPIITPHSYSTTRRRYSCSLPCLRHNSQVFNHKQFHPLHYNK